jgi:pimeloyl-ACP methyl ester carboxylesterase
MNRMVTGFLTSAAMLGAMEGFNVLARQRARPLTSPLVGEEQTYLWKWGRVGYSVSGHGSPILLVHGIHAAASSYEMRELFGPLTGTHRVYAPDLLGFGRSDRPALHYTGNAYVELLADFLHEVVREPCHVVASSLSGAYAIEVARRLPAHVTHLTLCCPTGLEALTQAPTAAGQALYLLLRAPVTGEALFNLLVSGPSLRHYLQERVYYDPARVTDQVIEQYYATAHRPNARYAPAAFVGGYLNWDARESYRALPQPVLVLWGRDAIYTPVTQAQAFAKLNPRARLHIFERCRLLPHDEHAEAVIRLLLEHDAGRLPEAST